MGCFEDFMEFQEQVKMVRKDFQKKDSNGNKADDREFS